MDILSLLALGKAGSGGGGGTSETYLVTVTGEGNTYWITDRTMAQLNAAYAAGKVLRAKFPVTFNNITETIEAPLVPFLSSGTPTVYIASFTMMLGRLQCIFTFVQGSDNQADINVNNLTSVLCTEQSLTDEQKAQARTNIEAVKDEEITWDATVTIGFEVQQGITATVGGTTFVKTSDKFFTAEQLDGAVFTMIGQGTVEISASDLTDMSVWGYSGTMINVPGFGNVIFCAYEASDPDIPSPGCYLVSEMSSYASVVTLSYTDTLSASIKLIAVSDMEMEVGQTNLPTGVVYLQVEN